MLDAIISTTPYLFTKDLSNINFYANVKYICSHFHNRVRSKLELPADLNWSSLQIWASCQVQSGKWFLCGVLQYKTYFCGSPLSLSLSFCNDGHCFISNYSKNRPAPLPGQNFPSTFIGWIDLYDDTYNLPCVCKINIARNPVFCLVI